MGKLIENFEHYIINDNGDNEKSIWSIKTNKWIKPRYMPSGYIQMCLTKNGKHYYFYLHRLLGETFLEHEENKNEIDHINGNRNDNRLCNLRWVDKKGNMSNPITRTNCSIAAYNKPPMSEETKSKLSKKVYQYTLDGKLVKIWDKVKDVESEGFCRHNVAACCRGVVKTHKGYKWSYVPL